MATYDRVILLYLLKQTQDLIDNASDEFLQRELVQQTRTQIVSLIELVEENPGGTFSDGTD